MVPVGVTVLENRCKVADGRNAAILHGNSLTRIPACGADPVGRDDQTTHRRVARRSGRTMFAGNLSMGALYDEAAYRGP
jgi:hypothetical protein